MIEFTKERIETLRRTVANEAGSRSSYVALQAIDEIERLRERIEELEGENSRLSVLLHDEMNQLELTIDLSNKRWIALNNIYTDGEKHNANWCKRKAQEGLGIK